MFRRRVPGRQSERGAVALTTAMFLAALLGFFALSFNVGLMMDTRTELQNGSDAAALAAARSLNGQASGLDAARLAATAYSLRHTAYSEAITINANAADLIFGRWHLIAAECTFGSNGHDCFESLSTVDPRKISAVKIRNGRDGGSHNAPLTLPFGVFVGSTTASVRSAAVAVGGGAAAVDCALPLAVAECELVDASNQMKCGPGSPQHMVFSNANVDAVGFANLYYPGDSQAPNETFVADVINTRLCNPSEYKIGPTKLQNGTDFAKVIDALRAVDNKGKPNGNTCLIGKLTTLPVTDAGCPGNPIFQGEQQVVGYVKATITAVTDNKGNPLGCPGDPTPVITGSPKSAVFLDIPCDAPTEAGEWGGGRSYNTKNVRTRLVQ